MALNLIEAGMMESWKLGILANAEIFFPIQTP